MTPGSESDIERLVAPSMETLGYDLVRVKLVRAGRTTLQIMAERRDGERMTTDDCAEISRVVSTVLDVEDPVPGSYHLEVSSPGIDRPLVRRRDFERFAGHEARIETRQPIEGRRRFRGRLLSVAGDRVRIAVDRGEAEIPLEDIRTAKLVLTDELIAATDKQRRME